MKITTLIAAPLLLLSISSVEAGSLSNGAWQPAGCGNKPEAPSIDSSDADAYNKSVANINSWQQKARDYFECLVKEANTDNAIIADSANQAQAKYREAVEKISADANAAKKKLDKQ